MGHTNFKIKLLNNIHCEQFIKEGMYGDKPCLNLQTCHVHQNGDGKSLEELHGIPGGQLLVKLKKNATNLYIVVAKRHAGVNANVSKQV